MTQISEPNLSRDALFGGRIRVLQPSGGYRFSLDAVLLAHQARPRPGDKVLDLGTGCGIVPLILCHRHPDVTVWGVEIQAPLAELALRNATENRLHGRITILNRDLRRLDAAELPGPFDLVVANPPFRREDSGRVNPNAQRAVARHEIAATLEDVLGAARRLLRTAGRLVTVYTAERAVDMLAGMRAAGIEPKCLRAVHSTAPAPAKLILTEGVRGAQAGIAVSPPLFVRGPDGRYCEEVGAMFQA